MLPALLAMPIAFTTVFLLCTIATRGRRYEMDNGAGRMSFFAPFAIYRRHAYTTFGTGLMLSGVLEYFTSPFPAGLMLGAAITSYLFVAWLTWCYEMYLQSKWPTNPPVPEESRHLWVEGTYVGPTNYTAARYSITIALGATSVFLFVLGLLAAALQFSGY